MGDFNLPTLTWDRETRLPVPSTVTDAFFVDSILNAHNLYQANFNPTRGDNILDLVLCSDSLHTSSATGDDLFDSDHSSVSVSLHVESTVSSFKSNRPNFNFHKADLHDLHRTLECIPWCLLEATSDSDEATALFHDFIGSGCASDGFFPVCVFASTCGLWCWSALNWDLSPWPNASHQHW